MFRKTNIRNLIFASLFLTSFSSFGQDFEAPIVDGHGTGAIPLSDEAMAAIPTVNWDTLAKYSPIAGNQALFRTTGGVCNLPTPKVRNQGSQSSCVGFAFATMIAIMFKEATCKPWSKDVMRSPAYIYNKLNTKPGCGHGISPDSAAKLVTTKGVCSWNQMPYEATCGKMPSSTQNRQAAQCKGGAIVPLKPYAKLTATSVNDIKKALNQGYPVAACFDATDCRWDSKGKVVNYKTTKTDHEVCIVGYDDNKQLIKVQNSWGSNWGDGGFFYVPYSAVSNNFFCGGLIVVYGVRYSATARTLSPDPVTLYSECDYNGTDVSLTEGSYDMSDLIAKGMGNEGLHSFEVADGYKVILYSKPNFSGNARAYTSGNICLADNNFSDAVQSIKVLSTNRTGGINETLTGFSALISPNPATDKIQLHIEGAETGEAHIQMMNLQGQIVLDRVQTLQVGTNDFSLERGSLPAGMYIIQCSQGTNRMIEKVLFQ